MAMISLLSHSYVSSLNDENQSSYFLKLKQLGFSQEEDPFSIVIEERTSNSKKKKNGTLEKWSSSKQTWPKSEFGDVYVFLLGCPSYTPKSLKVYKSLDAYKHAVNGRVDQLYIRHSQTGHSIIKAIVEKFEEETSDGPQKAWVGFNNEDGSIISGHCTCMTGSAPICSHVAAIAFRVGATPRSSIKEKESRFHSPTKIKEDVDKQEDVIHEVRIRIITENANEEESFEEESYAVLSTGFHASGPQSEFPNALNVKVGGETIMVPIGMDHTFSIPEGVSIVEESSAQPAPTTTDVSTKVTRALRGIRMDHTFSSPPKGVSIVEESSAQSAPAPTPTDVSTKVTKALRDTKEGHDIEDDFEDTEKSQPQSFVAVENNSVLGCFPFVCRECGLICKTPGSLKMHMAKHEEKRLAARLARKAMTYRVSGAFPCDICGKVFRYPSDRKTHMAKSKHIKQRLIHPKKNPCKKVFDDSHSFQAHMETVPMETVPMQAVPMGTVPMETVPSMEMHEVVDKPFKCITCQKSFKREITLKNHRLKVHREPFQCRNCGERFLDNVELSEHRKIHRQTFLCCECGKSFSRNKWLINHMRFHTKEKPYKCTICEETFFEHDTFTSHIESYSHNSALICQKCGEGFRTLLGLHKHSKAHAVEKLFKCKECGKGFEYMRNKSRHERTHTGEKRFVCEVCGKAFSRQFTLTLHTRLHTGEKPYPCTECGERFILKNRLLHHQAKTHLKNDFTDKDLIFPCEMCDKKFFSKAQLRSHARTHSEERPFVCNLCGVTYKRDTNLVRHMRRHTGEMPYKCKVCGRGFTVSSAVIVHMRTHTKEKPYRCDVCGLAFSENRGLIKHSLKEGHARTHLNGL